MDINILERERRFREKIGFQCCCMFIITMGSKEGESETENVRYTVREREKMSFNAPLDDLSLLSGYLNRHGYIFPKKEDLFSLLFSGPLNDRSRVLSAFYTHAKSQSIYTE